MTTDFSPAFSLGHGSPGHSHVCSVAYEQGRCNQEEAARHRRAVLDHLWSVRETLGRKEGYQIEMLRYLLDDELSEEESAQLDEFAEQFISGLFYA